MVIAAYSTSTVATAAGFNSKAAAALFLCLSHLNIGL